VNHTWIVQQAIIKKETRRRRRTLISALARPTFRVDHPVISGLQFYVEMYVVEIGIIEIAAMPNDTLAW